MTLTYYFALACLIGLLTLALLSILITISVAQILKTDRQGTPLTSSQGHPLPNPRGAPQGDPLETARDTPNAARKAQD